MSRKKGVEAYPSDDADSQRIWWTDAGVHQNLTFPVHPDPISGMHCWHQAVRVTRARPEDQYGDMSWIPKNHMPPIKMAGADSPGRTILPGWNPSTILAATSAETGAGGISAADNRRREQ